MGTATIFLMIIFAVVLMQKRKKNCLTQRGQSDRLRKIVAVPI